MNKNQKGFAVLESLLILIIIATIDGIGWYAIHTKHQTDKILAQSDKISQSTPVGSSKTDSSSQKYFTISQWGIRAPYSGSLKLQYTLSNDGKTAVFTSDQLMAADSRCSRAGAILKALPTEPVGPTGDSAQSEAAQGAITTHIGNFYYVFVHDQSGCSDKQNALTLQDQNNDAVRQLTKDLQAIPN
jgi:hypothetical protein